MPNSFDADGAEAVKITENAHLTGLAKSKKRNLVSFYNIYKVITLTLNVHPHIQNFVPSQNTFFYVYVECKIGGVHFSALISIFVFVCSFQD